MNIIYFVPCLPLIGLTCYLWIENKKLKNKLEAEHIRYATLDNKCENMDQHLALTDKQLDKIYNTPGGLRSILYLDDLWNQEFNFKDVNIEGAKCRIYESSRKDKK